MLAERDGSTAPWTTEGKEVRRQRGEPHAQGLRLQRNAGGVFTSSTEHTRRLKHAKFKGRNSAKMEGEGQRRGKNELSDAKGINKMLCWGCGTVTSVVVLSLVHDRHCLNTK